MKNSAQVKKNAVLEVLKDKKTVVSVAKAYKISRKCLYSWINRYKASSGKGKITSLEAKYKSGKSHPRALIPAARYRLIQLIVAHPDWGCRHLSVELKKEGKGVNYNSIYKFLAGIGAGRPDLRANFKRNFAGPGRLMPDVRQEIVRKVKEGNTSITSISREYGIARKTIYKWIKKYQTQESLSDLYVKGINNPRAIYPKITQQVLGMVAANPEYSVHTLAKFVPASSWTVWSILNRNNLNTYGLRLEYSRKNTEVSGEKTPED